MKIARWLTHNENLRTDTEYEDQLILKIMLFEFTNSYASLFYLAFFAQVMWCVWFRGMARRVSCTDVRMASLHRAGDGCVIEGRPASVV